jgi:hypothetical protein
MTARAITVLAMAYLAYGCASTPTTTARDANLPSCRNHEVVYCGANGSRSGRGICTCMSQSAAKAVVDNL